VRRRIDHPSFNVAAIVMDTRSTVSLLATLATLALFLTSG
jgi:hypothetical protein